MKRSGEEILADIDATLDQLILNADCIQHVPLKSLEENEVEALHKTQESLLAHLIHMDCLLDPDHKKMQLRKQPAVYQNIQHKISEFGKLNARLINDVATRFGKKPRVHRRRKKELQK
jgi:hypothetical protein